MILNTAAWIPVIKFALRFASRHLERNGRLRQFIEQAKEEDRTDITPSELEQFVEDSDQIWDEHLDLVREAISETE